MLSVVSEKSCEEEESESVEEQTVHSSGEENESAAEVSIALQPLERSFIVCVLKDAINQLIIANNGEKHVYPLEKRKPMSERFQTPCRDSMFHERTLGKARFLGKKDLIVGFF